MRKKETFKEQKTCFRLWGHSLLILAKGPVCTGVSILDLALTVQNGRGRETFMFPDSWR